VKPAAVSGPAAESNRLGNDRFAGGDPVMEKL
jgi:hypothetical protein